MPRVTSNVIDEWVKETPELLHTVNVSHKRDKDIMYVWVYYPHIPHNVPERNRRVHYKLVDGKWQYGGDI